MTRLMEQSDQQDGHEMSILDEPNPEAEGNRTAEDHRSTYQAMMDFGFTVGLPVSLGITMFFIILLLGEGILAGIFFGFLTWLGVLGISKTFFVH